MAAMKRAPADRFVVDSFEPAYARASVAADLPRRAEVAVASLDACHACPRKCEADRAADETGFCRTGRYARVSSAFPHRGEERCLSGTNGSGTIFFSLCNLRCAFCQNADISQQPSGQLLRGAELADLMLSLQAAGCHNVNFVSPSHVVPQVLEAVAHAVPRGLHLPLVYNTNAYDSVESLRLLDGVVDIYMPDFKFWSSHTGARLSSADDYPQRARDAIREMHRQVGDLVWDEHGIAKRGLLVRHLVMPGQIDQSAEIFRWLANEISRDTFVNVMAQYRPAHRVGRRRAEQGGGTSVAFSEINRPPYVEEIEQAYAHARGAGLWRFDA
jgi:putative pyruvate formate lyase activating enzyme